MLTLLKLNYQLQYLKQLLLIKPTLILFNHKEYFMKDNPFGEQEEYAADLVLMRNTMEENTHQKQDLKKDLEFNHHITIYLRTINGIDLLELK